MKKSLLIFIIILVATTMKLSAQIEVVSFKILPSDLTARIDHPVKDQNGDLCALIKVVTTEKGFDWDGGLLGVRKTEQKTGEIWVYIPHGARKLTIKHSNLGVLRDYMYPEAITEATVYEMILNEKVPNSNDMVKLSFQFNTTGVMIKKDDGISVIAKGAMAEYYLPTGSYMFEFNKEGFQTLRKEILVDRQKTEKIQLAKGKSITKSITFGNLSLKSEPAGSEVYLNGQKVGITPYIDRIAVGSYTVMIRKSMYYTKTFDVNIENNKNVIPLIKLNQKFGYYSISSAPEGADVIINNIHVGKTPFNKTKQQSGIYELTLKHDLFHDYSDSFIISDKKHTKIVVKMTPSYGELIINSEPTDAEVYIDNSFAGKTPYINSKTPSGSYNVVVKKKLWNDYSDVVLVNDAETSELQVPLNKYSGIININAKNSKIFINSKQVGTGSFSKSFVPGMYELTASRFKHNDDTRTVELKNGDVVNVDLQPSPILGTVYITTKPVYAIGAKVYINDKYKGDSPLHISMLYGIYSLKIKKDSYFDEEREIKVVKNENKTIEIKMKLYEGSVQQQIRKYNRRKNFWLVSTTVFSGIGVFYYYQAGTHYEEYKDATTSATNLHDQVKREDVIWKSSLIAAGISIIPFVFNVVRKNKLKQQIGTQLSFISNGNDIGVRLNF